MINGHKKAEFSFKLTRLFFIALRWRFEYDSAFCLESFVGGLDMIRLGPSDFMPVTLLVYSKVVHAGV